MNLTKKAEKSFYSISNLCVETPKKSQYLRKMVKYTLQANALNQYFYSVFIQDDDSVLPDMGNILYPDIPAVEVETAGISKLLSEIDPYKATYGPRWNTT